MVDRDRLVREVLVPARKVTPGGAGSAVIVEGLGLFVPELLGLFDLRVWVDVRLEEATAQGMWRDEHVWGNPQRDLWTDVWAPNDADFFRRFRPDLAADILFRREE